MDLGSIEPFSDQEGMSDCVICDDIETIDDDIEACEINDKAIDCIPIEAPSSEIPKPIPLIQASLFDMTDSCNRDRAL